MSRKVLCQLESILSAGAPLSPTTRALIANSLRPNTRRAYAIQISAWLQWRGLSDLEPANASEVANFIAELATAGRSLSTLRMIVAALKTAHEACGWQFEADHPVIGRVLRGSANAYCVLPRQAEPLRGDALLRILQCIADGKPSIQDRRDAAVLSVGYLFALRRSEIVGLDLQDQVIGDEKSWGVLRLRPNTIEIVLARSKTSKGLPETVAVPSETNVEAVRAIQAWVATAAIGARQPLFWSLTKGGKLKGRLSDQAVSAIVKSRVRRHLSDVARASSNSVLAGDLNRFSGHSLRVGLVVTAAEAGADLRSIARITRHRSLVMPARYAEQADQVRSSPHWLIGVGLTSKKEKE